ncbi:DnaT-like ssDNA-binding domain-containing protein [Brenneria roseae]
MDDGENLAEVVQTENQPPPEPVPPDYLDGVEIPTGKFTMFSGWVPSPDFRKRAAYWNRILDGPDPGFTAADLARFTSFWQADGRVLNHVQWEQKFADSVVYERRQESMKKPNGGLNAKPQSNTVVSGESRAMQKFREATAQRYGEDFIQTLAGDDRDLYRPLDSQERGNSVIDLERDDWSSDRGSDFEGG